MPVHEHLDEPALVARGLTNYWGYSTLGVLRARPPLRDPRAATPCASSRRWSSASTRAGIEVVLDVVYNHSCEGDALGPDVTLPRHRQPRLLPPRAGRSRATYVDYTRLRQHARRHAPAGAQARHRQPALLGRPRCTSTASASTSRRRSRAAHDGDVDRIGAFFAVVHQDPVLSRIKLIAEPWDVGARRLPGRQLSRSCGPSGTGASATPCARSGGATGASWPTSATASPGRAICSPTTGATRTRASTS